MNYSKSIKLQKYPVVVYLMFDMTFTHLSMHLFKVDKFLKYQILIAAVIFDFQRTFLSYTANFFFFFGGGGGTEYDCPKNWRIIEQRDISGPFCPPTIYAPQLQIICCYIARYYVKNSTLPGGLKNMSPLSCPSPQAHVLFFT